MSNNDYWMCYVDVGAGAPDIRTEYVEVIREVRKSDTIDAFAVSRRLLSLYLHDEYNKVMGELKRNKRNEIVYKSQSSKEWFDNQIASLNRYLPEKNPIFAHLMENPPPELKASVERIQMVTQAHKMLIDSLLLEHEKAMILEQRKEQLAQEQLIVAINLPTTIII